MMLIEPVKFNKDIEVESVMACSNGMHEWLDVLLLNQDRYIRQCMECKRYQENVNNKWIWVRVNED